jgi:hypothetical protein
LAQRPIVNPQFVNDPIEIEAAAAAPNIHIEGGVYL